MAGLPKGVYNRQTIPTYAALFPNRTNSSISNPFWKEVVMYMEELIRRTYKEATPP